jgi:hypothetical protein
MTRRSYLSKDGLANLRVTRPPAHAILLKILHRYCPAPASACRHSPPDLNGKSVCCPKSSHSEDRKLRKTTLKDQTLRASRKAGYLGKRVTAGIHTRTSQISGPWAITWPVLRAIIHLPWSNGAIWHKQPHHVIPLLEVKGGKTEGGSEAAPSRFPTTTCPSPTVRIWSANSQTSGV